MKRKQIKELDKLWADKVKKRANYKCEKCGKITYLHAHHIIPRTNYALRWHTENGVCLCRGCHLYWAHKDALDFTAWVESRRKLKFLSILRANQSKQDYFITKKVLEEL